MGKFKSMSLETFRVNTYFSDNPANWEKDPSDPNKPDRASLISFMRQAGPILFEMVRRGKTYDYEVKNPVTHQVTVTKVTVSVDNMTEFNKFIKEKIPSGNYLSATVKALPYMSGDAVGIELIISYRRPYDTDDKGNFIGNHIKFPVERFSISGTTYGFISQMEINIADHYADHFTGGEMKLNA